MKLGKCEAHNFGSYSHLEFDFSNVGLSLIYGSTGAGKSMLADLPAWILFGITAKNGAADDVRSWQSPDHPTKGVLDVQLSGRNIQVTRIRGKAGQNDLYWTEGTSYEKRRGKDLTETQRLLSDLLGVDDNLYLSASYFCDFSPSGQFFVAKAKDRRELFERIASLSLPVKLAERISDARKAAKKQLEKSELDLAKASGRLEQLKESYESASSSHAAWAQRHEAQVDALVARANPTEMAFLKDELQDIVALRPELLRAQREYQECLSHAVSKTDEYHRLKDIGETVCPACLSPQAHNTAKHARIADLSKAIKRAEINTCEAEAKIARLQTAMQKEDELRDDIRKLERAQRDLDNLEKENPFDAQLKRLFSDLEDAGCLVERLERSDIASVKSKIARLTRLYDLSFDLRGELLRKSVREIEISTNAYLEKYFDAEIRVSFHLEGSDDIDIVIQKSGFECSYRQLSKGQRRLLTLCFSIAIMQVSANSAGIHFDNIFMDEPTDGMDPELKCKAFQLFEDIANGSESVLVIEHSAELQAMFTNKYHVTMDSDQSSIEHEQS